MNYAQVVIIEVRLSSNPEFAPLLSDNDSVLPLLIFLQQESLDLFCNKHSTENIMNVVDSKNIPIT